MPISSQFLPPKVAEQWAEKALKGEADNWYPPSNYQFLQGRNLITITRCVPPVGYITRLSRAEVAALDALKEHAAGLRERTSSKLINSLTL